MYDGTSLCPLMASFGDGCRSHHSRYGRSELAHHYRCARWDLATIGLCLYRDGADSVAAR